MAKLIIRPTDLWQWFYDKEHDCLMLDISNDMVFRCRYSSKFLTPDAFGRFPFSVNDSASYYQFYEQCNQLTLSEPQKLELVLNAIVAANFLKPQMPKSWYFSQQPILFTPQFGELVTAQVQDSGITIHLLVVEVGENASLCLVAEPHIIMSGRTFLLGDTVKVMNDRLKSKNTSLNEYHADKNENIVELLNKIG